MRNNYELHRCVYIICCVLFMLTTWISDANLERKIETANESINYLSNHVDYIQQDADRTNIFLRKIENYFEDHVQSVTSESQEDEEVPEETATKARTAAEILSAEKSAIEIEAEKEVVIAPDQGENVMLPALPTDRKVCTDYRVYNISGTPHNRMQLAAHTDALGCRKYGEYYIVGLGSAYADRIGETFEVELDTGVIFKIITGDMKADAHTDPTNRYARMVNYDGEICANILEFIIDKEILDPEAYRWGGVDYYEKFKGDIIRMTYLGRDTSADWDTYM